jgi:hypothetical protein
LFTTSTILFYLSRFRTSTVQITFVPRAPHNILPCASASLRHTCKKPRPAFRLLTSTPLPTPPGASSSPLSLFAWATSRPRVFGPQHFTPLCNFPPRTKHSNIPRSAKYQLWRSSSRAEHTVSVLRQGCLQPDRTNVDAQPFNRYFRPTRTSPCNARIAVTSPERLSRDGAYLAPYNLLHYCSPLRTNDREWFTFCFVPIIPFSFKPWHAVHCHICQFNQDIKYRPDVQQQMDGGGPSIPMHNQSGPPQGWQGQQQQPYGQGGQPVYK